MSLQDKLNLFADNVQVINKDFVWKNTLAKRLAALLFTAESRTLDGEAIRRGEALIKRQTGLFSTFRGNASLTVATLLALADDPEQLLDRTLLVYDLMKAARFSASDFSVIAACLIAGQARPEALAATVERARAFYDGMKQEHWFLTGQDDYIFCAMLGLSGLEPLDGVARIERLYDDLRPDFRGRNAVQALAQVLVLADDAASPSFQVRNLRDAFKASGIRLDREYTLTSLGVLTLVSPDHAAIVQAVQAAYDNLRTRRGFGRWTIGRQELLLLAAALVAYESVSQPEKHLLTSTLSTSITAIIIAQQAAIVAATASSSSVAASSAGG